MVTLLKKVGRAHLHPGAAGATSPEAPCLAAPTLPTPGPNPAGLTQSPSLSPQGAKLTDAMQQRVRGMYTRLQTACNEDLQAPLSQGVWRALRDLMRSKPGLVLDYAAGRRPPFTMQHTTRLGHKFPGAWRAAPRPAMRATPRPGP
jgi:hypothetical protein